MCLVCNRELIVFFFLVALLSSFFFLFLLRSILFLILLLLFLSSLVQYEKERESTTAQIVVFFWYILKRASSFKIRYCCDATLSNWLPRACPVLCCTEFAAGIGIVNILQFRSYSSNLPTTFHIEVCRTTTKCFNSTMRVCVYKLSSHENGSRW